MSSDAAEIAAAISSSDALTKTPTFVTPARNSSGNLFRLLVSDKSLAAWIEIQPDGVGAGVDGHFGVGGRGDAADFDFEGERFHECLHASNDNEQL